MQFVVNGAGCRLRVPGRHNVANAAAAVTACEALEVPVAASAEILAEFRGIGRRLEVMGQVNGVTVIDDFAHNPDKISASLSALKVFPGRLLVMFQPHGFGPTRFLQDGLIEAFAAGLGEGDVLAMPEIFYAGGTAQKDISARDLIEAIGACGRQTEFIEDRALIAQRFADLSRPGDRVVVMGARDDTLTVFAQEILKLIATRNRAKGCL